MFTGFKRMFGMHYFVAIFYLTENIPKWSLWHINLALPQLCKLSLDTLTLPLETSQLCVKTCLVSHLTGKGSKNRWPLGRSVIKKTNCSFLPFQWRQMVSIIWSLAIDMCTISVTSEGSTTCQTTITMNLVLKLTTGQPWKYLIL